MADTATTTRPARARKAATAAKKTTAAKAAAPEETGEVERFVFECDQLPDTKNYAVFQPPKSSGCVGKLYAPLGTTVLKVAMQGPKS